MSAKFICASAIAVTYVGATLTLIEKNWSTMQALFGAIPITFVIACWIAAVFVALWTGGKILNFFNK